VSHSEVAIGGHHAPAMEPSPFAIPAKKLAMWLFIISDVMTFAACLVAYGFLRNATVNWPKPFPGSTIASVMGDDRHPADQQFDDGDCGSRRAGRRPRGCLPLDDDYPGGWSRFALLHLREWFGMIGQGMTFFKNPWGTGLFGGAYYSITGLELLHVIAALIAFVIVGLGYQRGRYNSDDIENCGLFWQFINIVWMFIVPLVYLMNVAG